MDTERTLKLPRAEELREFICYWPDDDDDDADGDYDDNGEDGECCHVASGPCPAQAQASSAWFPRPARRV